MFIDTPSFEDESVLKTIKSMFDSFPNTTIDRKDEWIIDAHELPFIYKITKCPSIGWNVFLQPKSNDFSTNETIDKLYHQIDLYLGSINLSHFNISDKEQEEVNTRMTALTSSLETLSTLPVTHHISQKSPGVLQVSYGLGELDSKPCMEIGYSPIFQRWDCDYITSEHEPTIVNQLRKEVINKVATHLIAWNLPFLVRA